MNKRPAIIAIIVIVIALGAVAVKWGLIDTMASGDYYVQIDNGKMHELHPKGGVVDPTGGMKWEYALDAYNDAGDKKEISFGTERQLRDGAYLRLTVVPVQGVVGWEEVQFDQMLPKVQAAFNS